jgi:hypothetical protein
VREAVFKRKKKGARNGDLRATRAGRFDSTPNLAEFSETRS